ncbi:MAG: serine/threonine protein kinase [Deltaproteobacteria bacterium]|nr:serine/threonine protein kinase [Deltaproteobacteria bacterium]
MSAAQLGRYRLLRRIGSGGMAEVFRAELVGAEGVVRELVLKKIHHLLAMDPEAVAMFVNEARIAARLRHPNVVQVYEFGKAGDGYFLAMELVEGCDLAAVVRAAGGALPVGVTVYVIAEVLEGLGYVHGRADAKGAPLGLVHRDVSPHNVLLGLAGEVKLADFGIAKAAAAGGFETAPHGVKGKYAYMAPEQARGEDIDARADVFAVGAMLYELLSGRRPHRTREDGDLVDAVRAGLTVPLEEVAPTVPEGLRAVTARALDPEASERFPDARAFREALLEAAEAHGLRPDKDTLRRKVSEVVASGAGVASTRADRTLTFDGPTPPPTSTDISAQVPTPLSDEASLEEVRLESLRGSGPSSTPVPFPEPPPATPEEAPKAPPGRRRLREVMVLLAGLLVVGLLAGRRFQRANPGARTRLSGAPEASGLARRSVVVALPDEVTFDPEVRAAIEGTCRCALVRAPVRGLSALASGLREGEVDLAVVSTTMLPALLDAGSLRPLEALVAPVDGETSRRLGRLFETPAGAFGLRQEGPRRRWYLVPVAAGSVALAVRRAALERALERFPAEREALDARLQACCGARLPFGFEVRRDPDEWTSWDLLAAAWTWSREGGTLWTAVGPTVLGHGTLVAREATADRATMLHWDAVYRSLGLLDPSVGARDDPSAAFQTPRVMAILGPWSALARVWDGGWTVARVPRGDSLELDASGDARRPGTRVSRTEVQGWVLGAGSAQVALSARALVGLSRPEALGALVAGLRGMPVAGDEVTTPARWASLAAFERRLPRAGRYEVLGGPSTAAEWQERLGEPAAQWRRLVATVEPGARVDPAPFEALREGR